MKGHTCGVNVTVNDVSAIEQANLLYLSTGH